MARLGVFCRVVVAKHQRSATNLMVFRELRTSELHPLAGDIRLAISSGPDCWNEHHVGDSKVPQMR